MSVSEKQPTEQYMEMNEWVFQYAYEKYEIDLGDSNAPCRNISELYTPTEFILDYGSDRGQDALRQSVAELYGRSSDEVLITHGAQEALFLYYFTYLSPGDNIITFKPGWKQSWDAPAKLGADITTLDIDPFAPFDMAALAQAIRLETKAIILNSPSNPTGHMLSQDEQNAIIRLAESKGLHLVCDDEYLVSLDSSLANRFLNGLSVSSLSKIYGLPGLRLGWVVADRDIISMLRENKHLTTISNSSYIENIATDVLKHRHAHIERYRRLQQQGKHIIEQWIEKHDDVFEVAPITEAPFCWIKLKKGDSSLEFCKQVLDRHGVLLMPSELFDAANCFRITYVRDSDELITGLTRISNVLTSGNENEA